MQPELKIYFRGFACGAVVVLVIQNSYRLASELYFIP